jgi:hypothetical protein
MVPQCPPRAGLNASTRSLTHGPIGECRFLALSEVWIASESLSEQTGSPWLASRTALLN